MRLRAFIAAYPGALAAALSACAALVFVTVAFFYWQAANHARSDALEAQQKASVEARRTAELARLTADIEPYAARLEGLRARVHGEIREGTVLSELQNLSRSSGTRLVNVRMEERAPLGNYTVRAAYIELQGGYGAVRDFMARLNEMSMAALVGNSILEKDPGGARQLHATLEIIVFAQGGGLGGEAR